MSMMSGYSTHAADFQSADPAALSAAFGAYTVARNAQTDAMAAAQVATEAKNTALDGLDNVNITPEPATLSLLAFGGLALLRKRK